MKSWHAEARPIPIEAQRVALAAASEQTDRLVVNPGTESVMLRRPVVWSMAQGIPYVAPWESAAFATETTTLLDGIENLVDVGICPGDPRATGEGPDVTLFLGLANDLNAEQVRALINVVQARVSDNSLFASDVDALALTLNNRSL
jgi:hypothetical protein